MKVTKIVREYITETVNNKYQPLLDAIEKKYAGANERVEEVKEQTRKELNDVAIKLFRERLAPFYTPEDLDNLVNDNRYFVNAPSDYWAAHPIQCKKRDEEMAKVRDERDAAVKNILITLELGGTKADLDRLLNEINPAAEV